MTNPFLDPNHQYHLPQNNELSEWYLKYDLNLYHNQIKTTDEADWIKIGENKALNLFHQAATHIPAYKDFLKKHSLDHNEIKSMDDFQQIPLTDKTNYISQYDLGQLCWNGDLSRNNIISFSSGSTGTPYFWPRDNFEIYEAAFFVEDYLKYYFEIDKKSTLFVNCYSMGIYVAGTYMTQAVELLAQKGYKLTMVTPGINYDDTLKLLHKLIPHFNQIVLCGYPPFIKDLVDMAPSYNVNLDQTDVKFLFGSEFFSEEWRENILEKTGIIEPFTSSTNLYGTADAGIFGFETPTTIMLRKHAAEHPQFNQNLFGSNLTPTFIQFNPALRYFETVNNELILTCPTGIPLIRYNLKDQGRVLQSSEINAQLEVHNTSLENLHANHKIQSTQSNLPYLYLTSRSDGAISFYAILIFPEYIRHGVEHHSLNKWLSGKLSMKTLHDNNHDPILTVHVELNQDVQPDDNLKSKVSEEIVESLRNRCAEFSFLENSIGPKALPQVYLHEKGTSYFKIGIKQKWIIK